MRGAEDPPAPPPACAVPSGAEGRATNSPFKNRFVPACLFCAAEDGWGSGGLLPGDCWLSTAGAERRGGAAVPLGKVSRGVCGENS